MLLKRRPLSFNFIFGNRKIITEEGDLVSREGGGWLSFSLKSKAAAKGVTCERTRCHCVGPRNCCDTWLGVWVRSFPSDVSELRNRSFYSRSVVVEHISCE
jgi:hypothetical protein